MEVMILASREGSSSGIVWVDVAANIVGFEVMNQVRIELRLSVIDRHGRADIEVLALAHSREAEIGDLPPLASASATCLGSKVGSLEGLLIHVLYQLDGALAKETFSLKNGE